jgi:acyl dehydratase
MIVERARQRNRRRYNRRVSEALPVVGRGFCFEDLKPGLRFRTHRRTLTEADLAAFVNVSWLTEELFTVADDAGRAISGRPVPAALVYACAEGLMLPTMQDTGLAFLNATLDVKQPTLVGDTIHVESEVVEHRLTSKGDRGLVRFANKVVNQRGETVLEYNPLRLLKRK